MSKINALRLINLNYNNNAIRISDEVFHLNGENTLLSLRNGGGKSVLVQMMTAPFVHKRYRDAKDRPFESYFTTNKPTFLLVEWVLDQGAGYVMTGMMVRRSQEDLQEQGENLEIVNFISEYQESGPQDIYHLPVVEKTKKEIVLKNFNACRQLFESYKRDPAMQFFSYDMNTQAQSRQYFEKLKEYQIDYKEWESIIKKVNLKESGLSELFADCRDEKGLVEKWFLDAVENKLNKDRNRMKEFQNIMFKYVRQYKDNRAKIERRDTIRRFREEADGILQRAQAYQQSSQNVSDCENRIRSFRTQMQECFAEAEQKLQNIETGQSRIAGEIQHTEYEQLSAEIHTLERQEQYHIANRDMFEMEQNALKQERDAAERQLQILNCARVQGEKDEENRAYLREKQRLDLLVNQNEDMEPERRRLGGILWNYFSAEDEKKMALWKENEQELSDLNRKIAQEKSNRRQLQRDQVEISGRQGAVQSAVRSYDEKEQVFNERYQANLIRNRLGWYESGELKIRAAELQKEQEQRKRQKLADYKQQEVWEETLRSRNRDLMDQRQNFIRKEQELENSRQELDVQKEALKERRLILRYLELPETQLYDTEAILNTADRKLDEITRMRRKLEKEEDELQKEYVRLTQGKVLELPDEFAALLSELGISYVFGMDYLKRNGNSAAENQKLVREHPFLPYALILSSQELKKLTSYRGEVCTSFPIPIVLRESLKQPQEYEGNVIEFSQVGFYVLFNENLLDEEKLVQLVREKEKQIAQKKEAAAIRKKEYYEYFKKREQIAAQNITPEIYQAAEEKVQAQEEALADLAENIRELVQSCADAEEQRKLLRQKLEKEEKETFFFQQRWEDFTNLQDAYARYLENRKEAERLEREADRLEERIRLSAEWSEHLEEKRNAVEIAREGLAQERKENKQKLLIYQEYENETIEGKEREDTFLSDADRMELEIRYQEMTAGFSAEVCFQEERVQEARGRFERKTEELNELQEKYALTPETWRSTVYSRKEEQRQETIFKDRQIRAEEKNAKWHEEAAQIRVLSAQIKDRMDAVKRRFGKEEILAETEIKTVDFESKLKELEYQHGEFVTRKETWERRARCFEEILTSLEQFADGQECVPVAWEQNFGEMTPKSLRELNGTLLRDYRTAGEECQEKRRHLTELLHKILRMELFQDEFYRLPLEHMLELSEQAELVIRQLDITLQSYERMMEKLEVDISMVEKEKERIAELLSDYLRQVHENLGRIDRNSTITIREKPVRMLKIQLPDWDENASLYHVRLGDFMDEITQRGLEIFDRNENASEYLDVKLTTRNLYDQVLGIGNVQIRLYKIEEQREYPITWAEVSKNSGGEGFLSAFVILTSLLYYMRKDETDLFAERNEGKVLLMDNPFAQTNAAHLLKPLMDMAKKTNTQLICLSGLGGDSIYNRFDNIYVLNLVAAGLRGGMQYLHADHLRGSEPETMVLSHIQVAEQEELVF